MVLVKINHSYDPSHDYHSSVEIILMVLSVETILMIPDMIPVLELES